MSEIQPSNLGHSTEPLIAVWPCDHGSVLVEPGPALKGYPCHECGAVAVTYGRLPEGLARWEARQVQGWIEAERAENARLRAILSDVAAAGVSFEDPRVGYVEVQIDRATWAAVQVQEHPPA